MAELSAEQGYEATKIADIVSRADVARKTLYDNFYGKEELFLAAFDLDLTEARAAVEEACDAIDAGWAAADRIRPARRCSSSSPTSPAAARICLVEAPAASPAPRPATTSRSTASSSCCGERAAEPSARRRSRSRWSAASPGSSPAHSRPGETANGSPSCCRSSRVSSYRRTVV